MATSNSISLQSIGKQGAAVAAIASQGKICPYGISTMLGGRKGCTAVITFGEERSGEEEGNTGCQRLSGQPGVCVGPLDRGLQPAYSPRPEAPV